MNPETARAGRAASAAFGAALVLYSLTGPFTPVWPASKPTTVAGQWLIDAVAFIPLGDPVARAASVAVVAGATSVALIAWIIARQGHGAAVAAGCALVAGFGASAWRQAIEDAPGSIAALFVVVAMAMASSHRDAALFRTIASGVSLSIAAALNPVVLGAAPLVVMRAAGGSTATLIAAGVAGVVTIAATLGVSSPPFFQTAMQLVGREWLAVSTVFLLSGGLAPLWGAGAAPTAVIGTVIVMALAMIGHDIAALSVFPATLLAHGLKTLPAIGPRARAVTAIVIAVIAAGDRWQERAEPAWRLTAWRDAIERTLPRGSRIRTGTRAAAALNGPLFAGRPSGIKIVYGGNDATPGASGLVFVLDDLRPSFASGGRPLGSVPLTFASAHDIVSRVPAGTIVGVAVSTKAAVEHSGHVEAVLRAIGRARPDGEASALTVVGIAGTKPGGAPGDARNPMHVLIGEVIEGSQQRSPTTFDLHATADRVNIRFRGRDVAAGEGWAVIVIDPRGPLIGAFASDSGPAGAPLQVPGLDIWRVQRRVAMQCAGARNVVFDRCHRSL